MLSAITAIVFSTILSSVIFYQFLDLIYTPNLSILGLSFLISIGFIFVAGIISIRKSIYASPMITLRDS
jgi:ABC-type antimicrobial peptide transport system permease subunit